MVSPRGFVIRPATPADAVAIKRVHEDSIRGLGPAAYRRDEVESWVGVLRAEGYVEAMTDGGERFLIAEDGTGTAVAFCSYKEDEIMGLYVAPGWARRGVGSALLRRGEAAIAAAGHTRIRIGAALSGQLFYEAHGYRVVRQRKWNTRGGLEIDVVDMEKVGA
jgi:putative acetyltransferase